MDSDGNCQDGGKQVVSLAVGKKLMFFRYEFIIGFTRVELGKSRYRGSSDNMMLGVGSLLTKKGLRKLTVG